MATSDTATHIGQLFAAELQFRLASAVRLAVTGERQPLDLPMQWSHGDHVVHYEEVALRQDQADYAASVLHRSATYLMAVAIKDAIRAVVHDPKKDSDPNVQGAYQIARLIRNAFAHSPFAPIWSIDPDCKDVKFSVVNTIALDTTGLHGTPFDWRHYGGPLALFRLCRFVRIEILKDAPSPRKVVPIPRKRIYQQGDLILEAAAEGDISSDAVPVESSRTADGRIDLGAGHYIVGEARLYERKE